MDRNSPLWREIEDVVYSAIQDYGHPQAVDSIGDAVGQILRIVELYREGEPKPAPADRSWIQFERGSVWD